MVQRNKMGNRNVALLIFPVIYAFLLLSITSRLTTGQVETVTAGIAGNPLVNSVSYGVLWKNTKSLASKGYTTFASGSTDIGDVSTAVNATGLAVGTPSQFYYTTTSDDLRASAQESTSVEDLLSASSNSSEDNSERHSLTAKHGLSSENYTTYDHGLNDAWNLSNVSRPPSYPERSIDGYQPTLHPSLPYTVIKDEERPQQSNTEPHRNSASSFLNGKVDVMSEVPPLPQPSLIERLPPPGPINPRQPATIFQLNSSSPIGLGGQGHFQQFLNYLPLAIPLIMTAGQKAFQNLPPSSTITSQEQFHALGFGEAVAQDVDNQHDRIRAERRRGFGDALATDLNRRRLSPNQPAPSLWPPEGNPLLDRWLTLVRPPASQPPQPASKQTTFNHWPRVQQQPAVPQSAQDNRQAALNQWLAKTQAALNRQQISPGGGTEPRGQAVSNPHPPPRPNPASYTGMKQYNGADNSVFFPGTALINNGAAPPWNHLGAPRELNDGR